MSFCPICNSILDVSKSAIKKAYNPDNSPSDTDDNDDKIERIISKLSKGENVDNLENIRIEQITGHESFSKLDKQKKASILSKLESIFEPQDDSTAAYYVCKTCSFSKKIETGTLIASKIGVSTQTNYLSMDRFKNKIYNRALPLTRRYICPNRECPGIKDPSKHEAVMYRIGDTMQMMYTCCACRTVMPAA